MVALQIQFRCGRIQERALATRTVGFAIEERDRARLERLAKKYAGGNRSAFLRVAMEYMEAADRAERLRRIQAHGADASARLGLTQKDVQRLVHEGLGRRKRA